MTETPYSDAYRANYRYHCDNDRGLNGSLEEFWDVGSRWGLRQDPPSYMRPAGYIPQRDRRWGGNEPWPEWLDFANAM